MCQILPLVLVLLLTQHYHIGIFLTKAQLPHCLPPSIHLERVSCAQIELLVSRGNKWVKSSLLVEMNGMMLCADAILALWKMISNYKIRGKGFSPWCTLYFYY